MRHLTLKGCIDIYTFGGLSGEVSLHFTTYLCVCWWYLVWARRPFVVGVHANGNSGATVGSAKQEFPLPVLRELVVCISFLVSCVSRTKKSHAAMYSEYTYLSSLSIPSEAVREKYHSQHYVRVYRVHTRTYGVHRFGVGNNL